MLWFILKKIKKQYFFCKVQTLATHHALFLLLFWNDEIQDCNQEPWLLISSAATHFWSLKKCIYFFDVS